MKKIFIVLSNTNSSLSIEWLCSKLSKENVKLKVILLTSDNSYLENKLNDLNIEVVNYLYYGKKNIFNVFFKVLRLFIKERPDVVHCHLFDACLVGLPAAWLTRVNNRIYTRHHSTNNWEYFPKIVKYDKLFNLLSTNIISISNIVTNVLVKMEKVKLKKIVLIHHGFNLIDFDNVGIERIDLIKNKYSIPENRKIIGVISRYVELKGVHYIIKAYSELLKEDSSFFLILVNPSGNYKSEISALLNKLPVNSYIEIPFENDIIALYRVFNYFVHVPINKEVEAFGQTYVEALLSGVPSVFTLSGVANEFIVNKNNALVVDYKNSESIKNAILLLDRDKELKMKIINNGKMSCFKFNYPDYYSKIKSLYNL